MTDVKADAVYWFQIRAKILSHIQKLGHALTG